MTISIGTFEDLEPSQPQPIDRNPDVACHTCSNSQNWKEWQEQYAEITPKTKLRCPACWGELIEQARIDRKAEQNKSIEDYL